MSNNKVVFANIEFRGLNREVLLREEDDLKIICTVNAEYIVLANRDPAFRQFLCDNYSTFDGQLSYLVARVLCRKAKFERVSGSDFIYDICQYARTNNKRVFLLGGYAHSNSKAVQVLRERYRIEIEGYSPKPMPLPFEESEKQHIVDHIVAFRPHFLLVALGAGKQDRWIRENVDILRTCGVKWAIGVGGTFEFVSGMIRRAPRFMTTIGLEGLFRLIVEPKMSRLEKVALRFKFFKYVLLPPDKIPTPFFVCQEAH